MDIDIAPTLLLLLVYVLWVIVLGMGLVGWRFYRLASSKEDPQTTPHEEDYDLSPYWRAYRAQRNATENLPIVATVIIVEQMIGTGGPWFVQMAMALVGLRILQSIIDVVSKGLAASFLRFLLYMTQMLITIAMVLDIVNELNV